MQIIEIVELHLDRLGNRNALGIGQRAEVTARAADDVGQQADIRCSQAVLTRLLPYGEEVAELHVCKYQVLLMGYTQFAEAILVGKVGNDVHLFMRGVARRFAVRLERQRDGTVARHAMRMHTAFDPGSKRRVAGNCTVEGCVVRWQILVRHGFEMLGDAFELSLGDGVGTILDVSPFLFNLAAEFFDAQCLDQDLDARLEDVVATAVKVVDADDRLAIGQQVLPLEVFADDLAENGGATETTANPNANRGLASLILVELETDIVRLYYGTVSLGAGNGDLELAWQEGEFRVEGAPLAQDFGDRTRIDHFIRGNTGEMIGGDVAHVIAGSLDAVHLHGGKFGQDVRGFFQLGPVELQVLARAEMAVTTVIALRDVAQLAQLARGQQAIGNGDAEHGRVALDIEAVAQAQRAEFILAQFPRQITPNLVAILRDAFVDIDLVYFVVFIHESIFLI